MTDPVEKQARRVLIVGAGVAGDCLAALLGRQGWSVTVVELADRLRSGGQNVDLRGPSAKVLTEMGLLETAMHRLVPQEGIAWVDRRGRALGRMPVSALDGRGFVSTRELPRSDLAELLHEACGPMVEHRFGETVVALTERQDAVRVGFRGGWSEDFDLVVGADGVHSRTRSLLFGLEEQFRRRLGLTHAWFTLTEKADTPPLDGWWQCHNASGRRVVEARPGHSGRQQVGFTVPDDQDEAAPTDRDDRLAQLRQKCAGVGWRTAELLDAAATASDLAFDTFDQIHLPQWHTERVVLLGDAAWCTSPLSGLGTALALTGAWVLADELRSTATAGDGLSRALSRWAGRMHPRVAAGQQLIPGRVAMYAPNTALGIRSAIWFYRLAQTRPAAALARRSDQQYGHDETLP